MKLFFESNPGLKSRFNTFIEFEDYDEEELDGIMNMMCKKNDYVLSKNGVEKVKAIIAYGVAHKGEEFANGRLVRNLYEDMVMNHARRVNTVFILDTGQTHKCWGKRNNPAYYFTIKYKEINE